MGREPQKHWKASHKCWYVKVNGQFIRLDPDDDKAQQLYHEIMAGRREITPDTQVAQLILDYLEWSKKHHKARTHEWYKDHLESFSKHIGCLRLQSLKPFHVEQWIDKIFPNTKNGTTIGNAMRTVVRVCNWAKKSGRIAESPLFGMERPAPTNRDVYLIPDEYKALIGRIENPKLLDLVVLMRESGCRPQEARHIEARHFDRRNKCLVIPKDEAKGVRLTGRLVQCQNQIRLRRHARTTPTSLMSCGNLGRSARKSRTAGSSATCPSRTTRSRSRSSQTDRA
jgi:integrase